MKHKINCAKTAAFHSGASRTVFIVACDCGAIDDAHADVAAARKIRRALNVLNSTMKRFINHEGRK
jgi:hypothetical protein